MLLSAVAVAATGIAVSSGVLTEQDAVVADAHPALRAAPRLDEATAALAERERSTSRSARRTTIEKKVDKKNKADDRDRSSARRAARTKNPADGNPRDIARALLPKFGFSADQFGCLDALYVSESGWNPRADNPTSSAYGIPQALTEAHELPADYMTNPTTQIRWGLGYIRGSYGTPCGAWSFKQANGWY